MEYQDNRRRFHNAHEWRRFFLLWFTVILWLLFLFYMMMFHFQRDSFEPLVMAKFALDSPEDYLFVEVELFMGLLWSCCLISVLAIVNTWNKKRRKGDHTPDMYLVVIMAVTVSFAFYYAKHDLDYLHGHLSFLTELLGAG